SSSAYFAAAASDSAFLPYRLLNRSTRPAVSTSFCLPVKNGWHAEQISTCRSSLRVERVLNGSPHAQVTVISLYSGWIPGFISSSPDIVVKSSSQSNSYDTGCTEHGQGADRSTIVCESLNCHATNRELKVSFVRPVLHCITRERSV